MNTENRLLFASINLNSIPCIDPKEIGGFSLNSHLHSKRTHVANEHKGPSSLRSDVKVSENNVPDPEGLISQKKRLRKTKKNLAVERDSGTRIKVVPIVHECKTSFSRLAFNFPLVELRKFIKELARKDLIEKELTGDNACEIGSAGDDLLEKELTGDDSCAKELTREYLCENESTGDESCVNKLTEDDSRENELLGDNSCEKELNRDNSCKMKLNRDDLLGKELTGNDSCEKKFTRNVLYENKLTGDESSENKLTEDDSKEKELLGDDSCKMELTRDGSHEKELIRDNLCEKELIGNCLYEKELVRDYLNEKELARDDLSEKELNRDDLCETELTGDESCKTKLREKESFGDYSCKKELTGDSSHEKELTRDDLCDKKLAKVDLCEEELARENLYEEELTGDVSCKNKLTGDDLGKNKLKGDDSSEKELIRDDSYEIATLKLKCPSYSSFVMTCNKQNEVTLLEPDECKEGALSRLIIGNIKELREQCSEKNEDTPDRIQVAEPLLADDPKIAELPSEKCQTALDSAINKNARELRELCSEKNEESVQDRLRSVERLLADDTRIVELPSEDGHTAIDLAAINNQTEILSTLLVSRYGADASLYNSIECFDALLHTIANQAYDCFVMLLDRKVNVNATGSNDQLALHHAVKHHNNTGKMVAKLLEYGADVNKLNRDKQTPLHVAARFGDCDALQELLNAKPKNINMLDSSKSSPLHLAADKGHRDCCDILMKAGANCSIRNRHRDTPLMLAVRNCFDHTCEILLQDKETINAVNSQKHTPLIIAATSKKAASVSVMQLLLQQDPQPDVTVKASYNETALHFAAKIGSAEKCEELIKAGADRNAKNDQWMTPLHFAASRDFSSCVAVLLGLSIEDTYFSSMSDNGSDIAQLDTSFTDSDIKNLSTIDCKDKHGMTPLHYALAKGSQESCKMLLKKRANVNVLDNNKNTPLHIAAENELTECCIWLLSKGADVKATNKENKTALHLAAGAGSHACCNLLIKRGAELSIVDKDCLSPLHYAAKVGSEECCNLLLKKVGHKFDFLSTFTTPLHLAAQEGYLNCCKLLAENQKTRKYLIKRNKDGQMPHNSAFEKEKDSAFCYLLPKAIEYINSDEFNEQSQKSQRQKARVDGHNSLKNSNKLQGRKSKEDGNRLSQNFSLIQRKISVSHKDMAHKTNSEKVAQESTENYDKSEMIINEDDEQNFIKKLMKLCKRNSCEPAEMSSESQQENTQGGEQMTSEENKPHGGTSKENRRKSARKPSKSQEGNCGKDKYTSTKNDNKRTISEENRLTFTPALSDLLSRSIQQNRSKAVEAIVKCGKWKEALWSDDRRSLTNNLCLLINHFPQEAKTVLDKCIKKDEAGNKLYNFIFLENIYHCSGYDTTDDGRRFGNFFVSVMHSLRFIKALIESKAGERIFENLISKFWQFFLVVGGTILNFFIYPGDLRIDEKTNEGEDEQHMITDLPEWSPFDVDGSIKSSALERPATETTGQEHPLICMVENERLDLIQHELCQRLLNYKWDSYVKRVFFCLFSFSALFVVVLSVYVTLAYDWVYVHRVHNLTRESICEHRCTDSSREQIDHHNSKLSLETLDNNGYCISSEQDFIAAAEPFQSIARYSALVILIVNIIIDMFRVHKLSEDYRQLKKLIPALVSYISSFVLLVNWTECTEITEIREEWQWVCGVLSVMLGWFNLVMLLGWIPGFGVYFIILNDFMKTMLKLIVFLLLQVVAFSFAFQMLLRDRFVFSNYFRTTVKILTMLMGDLSYDDHFSNEESPLHYPLVSHLLLLCFLGLISVITLNLISNFSQGELDKAKEQTKLITQSRHVKMMLEMESMFPLLRRHYAQGWVRDDPAGQNDIVCRLSSTSDETSDEHRKEERLCNDFKSPADMMTLLEDIKLKIDELDSRLPKVANFKRYGSMKRTQK